jgi:cbb3-type cytochrome oxidase maturation protein
MGIIPLLICISLTIAIVFLIIFCWSMKSGQYDDTYTPSVRMLFEDKKVQEETTKKTRTLNKEVDSSMAAKDNLRSYMDDTPL